FFQAEDGIRDWSVTGVQTCALPISLRKLCHCAASWPHSTAAPCFCTRLISASDFISASTFQVLRGMTSRSSVSRTLTASEASRRSEERRVGKEGRSRGGADV